MINHARNRAPRNVEPLRQFLQTQVWLITDILKQQFIIIEFISAILFTISANPDFFSAIQIVFSANTGAINIIISIISATLLIFSANISATINSA